MKKIAFIVLMILCSHTCLSQINSGPSPTIGWDSLKSLIKYPDLARRAGLWGFAIVTVDVSSKGEVIDLKIRSEADIFTDTIKRVLSDIKWNPAMKDSHAVQGTAKVPIKFILNDEDECPSIIIEAKRRR